MFIGHFAVGMAAKRWAPKTSLGTLFLACQLPDLLWPMLVLTHVETVKVDWGATAFSPLDFVSYPYSHGLVAVLVCSVVLGVLWYGFQRSLRDALVVAVVAFSHWVLDFISHRPDLPLWSDHSPKWGLGLWNSVAATFGVETLLFGLGAYLYASTRPTFSRRGKWSFALLLAFLFMIYLGNAFGPKPPEHTPPGLIAGPALAMWLIVAWGYGLDRRSAKKETN